MLAQTIARGTISIQGKISNVPVPVFFISGNGQMVPTPFIKNMRAGALRADAEAVRMMSRAGFDPAALRRYIERTQPPDQPHSPFPPRATRIAALQEATRDIPSAVYSESNEFYRIQALVRPAPSTRPPPSLLR
jgi:hypothetical protein